MKLPTEPVKRGKRTLGSLITAPDGRRVFLWHSRVKDIRCNGEKSISDAIRKGVATWSIEEEFLIKMRANGVLFSGVLCKDNGDIWLTSTDRFFDSTIARPASGGYFDRRERKALPLQCFRRKAGRMKFR